MPCEWGEKRTARAARVCSVNFLSTARELVSKSCTQPCCPPTASAFPSARSTPLYATSLKRWNVLCGRRDLELYTVTRAEEVTARWWGYASANATLVTWLT